MTADSGTREFEFDFEASYRLPALVFGITPASARVARHR